VSIPENESHPRGDYDMSPPDRKTSKFLSYPNQLELSHFTKYGHQALLWSESKLESQFSYHYEV